VTFAVPQDVAAELGRPLPTKAEELAQWGRWLQRAENQIRARIPDLDSKVADDPDLRNRVIDVESAAVARKALNPEGLRQTTKSVDDGSVTKIVDSSRSIGEVEITESEWALLTVNTAGAFSIRTATSTPPQPYYNDHWPARPRAVDWW